MLAYGPNRIFSNAPRTANRSQTEARDPLAENRRQACAQSSLRRANLVELKQRLREISDLNAAGDVLNWDQATYMPEGGAGARGRQR